MGEKEVKKEKNFYKKWWFWVIIAIMIAIVSFTSIILIGFYMINPDKNLTEIAKELQNYDNNITIYQSADKNIILINLNANTIEEINDKSRKIGEILGKYLEYLGMYNDIKFNISTKEGEKTTFTFDIETKKVNEETNEIWILDDSVAYNKKQEELKELETKKSELSTDIASLEEKKQTLNSEIEQLNGEAIKLKGTPKTYPAGHLTAGTDIPLGRYKIYEGNSNFIVYSSTGKLEVNIILGESFGVDEYIYTFKSGDKIEANSSFKLVEVE